MAGNTSATSDAPIRVTEVAAPSKPMIYSRYRGCAIPVDTTPDKFKDLNTRVLNIWENSKDFLESQGVAVINPEDWDSLEISLSHLEISFQGRKYRETDLLQNPQLLQEMKDVRTAAKKVLQFSQAAEFGIECNRNLQGSKNLILTDRIKEATSVKDADEFFSKHSEMVARFPDKAVAQVKIRETDQFIANFKKELESKLGSLPDGVRLPEPKRKLKKKLSELIEQLENCDRYAIFCNVGFSGKAQTPTLQATKIKEAVIADLTKKVRKSLKEYFLSGKESEALKDYAADVGDLSIHDRATHMIHVNNEEREMKRASMEEFIVHQMSNPVDRNDLSSLGLPLDDQDETRRVVIGALLTV